MSAVSDHYVLKTDAASRLAIHIINHANSPLSAQCGDFSHDKFRGGFISGDGRVHVSKDASYVKSLPPPWQTMGPYVLPPDPVITGYVPMLSQGEQPLSSMSLPPAVINPTIPAPSMSTVPGGNRTIPSVRYLSPHEIPDLLSYLTGQYDVIYICRSLGLDRIDFDKASDGNFIRTFADNLINPPIGASMLNIFNHEGVFVRANVLLQGSVFELKVFKFTDRRGLYPFLFKPEHPDVWFNTSNGLAPSGDIVLDTCIHNVLNTSLLANAWLNDAGDVAKIDWEIFRWHRVIIIWHSEDSLLSRNHFAAALHFVSEARKHGLDVSVFDTTTGTYMDLPLITQQAYQFNLEIPQNMNIESTFNKELYNNASFNF